MANGGDKSELERLRQLFYPDSIAVVGASRDPRNIGHRYLVHLLEHGYPAERIQVVHPSGEEVAGRPAVSSVGELEGAVDLGLILTAGDRVPELLEQLGEHGVGGVNVFANDGAVISEPARLCEIAKRTGTRILGPNSPGYISVQPDVAAHATQMLSTVRLAHGPVGVISHSGAIGGIVGRSMLECGAGFDTLICTGNEIDLELGECLEFLATERELRAVGLFVETIRDVESFRRGLRAARAAGTKVCALKVGWSEAARRAAAGHTGADAGRVDLFEAELRREGATLCRDLAEMVAMLAVSSLPAPGPGGLLIGATSGGLTSVLGDTTTAAGLPVPALEGFDNPWDTDIQVVHEPELTGEEWMRELAREEVAAGVLALSAQPDRVMAGLAAGMSRSPAGKPMVVIPYAGLAPEMIAEMPAEAIVWEDAAGACRALAWALGGAEPPAEEIGSFEPDPEADRVKAAGIEPNPEAAAGNGAIAVQVTTGRHPTYGAYATVAAPDGLGPVSVPLPTDAAALKDALLANPPLAELTRLAGPAPVDSLAAIVVALADQDPVRLDPLLLPLDADAAPSAAVKRPAA
ncbi:MAG: CoA-binding protein [Solirubrobacterales bacterium]